MRLVSLCLGFSACSHVTGSLHALIYDLYYDHFLKFRTIVILSCVATSVGIILSLIGVIVDGIGLGVVDHLKSCCSVATGE